MENNYPMIQAFLERCRQFLPNAELKTFHREEVRTGTSNSYYYPVDCGVYYTNTKGDEILVEGGWGWTEEDAMAHFEVGARAMMQNSDKRFQELVISVVLGEY